MVLGIASQQLKLLAAVTAAAAAAVDMVKKLSCICSSSSSRKSSCQLSQAAHILSCGHSLNTAEIEQKLIDSLAILYLLSSVPTVVRVWIKLVDTILLWTSSWLAG